MKRVTATEARRNWFRLLDEVAQGVVVCIERGGRRIVLRREPESEHGADLADYGTVFRAPKLDEADTWSWRRAEPPICARISSSRQKELGLSCSPGRQAVYLESEEPVIKLNVGWAATVTGRGDSSDIGECERRVHFQSN